MIRFICWTDSNNLRGYIPESAPHTYKQVGAKYYLEAPGLTTAEITSPSNIFIVTKLEHAISWVKSGSTAGKLAETCAEKGI